MSSYQEVGGTLALSNQKAAQKANHKTTAIAAA